MREFKDSISGKDEDDEAVHHQMAAELPPADEAPLTDSRARVESRERDTVT